MSKPMILFAILGAVAALLAVGYYLIDRRGQEEVRARVMADYDFLVKAGYPTTLVDAKAPVQPGQTNSAPIIAEAHRLETTPSLPARKAATAEDWEKWKAANSKWVSLVETAAQGDVYSPERQGDFVVYADTLDLMTLRKGAKFLAIDAVAEAARGRDESAHRLIGQAFCLGSLAQDEPTLLGRLVSTAALMGTLSSAETLATLWRSSPQDLKRLEEAVRAFRGPEVDLPKMLRGEFLLSLDTARNARHLSSYLEQKQDWMETPKVDASQIAKDGPPKGRREVMIAEPILRLHVEAFKLTQGSLPGPAELGRQLDALTPKVKSNNPAANALLSFDGSPFTTGGEGIESFMARRAAVLAAIGLLRATPEGAAFPDKLASIPSLPSGKPAFEYHKTPNGFAITPLLPKLDQKELALSPEDRRGSFVYPRPFSPTIFQNAP